MARHEERDPFKLIRIRPRVQLHLSAGEETLQRRLQQVEQPLLEEDDIVRRADIVVDGPTGFLGVLVALTEA